MHLAGLMTSSQFMKKGEKTNLIAITRDNLRAVSKGQFFHPSVLIAGSARNTCRVGSKGHHLFS